MRIKGQNFYFTERKKFLLNYDREKLGILENIARQRKTSVTRLLTGLIDVYVQREMRKEGAQA